MDGWIKGLLQVDSYLIGGFRKYLKAEEKVSVRPVVLVLHCGRSPSCKRWRLPVPSVAWLLSFPSAHHVNHFPSSSPAPPLRPHPHHSPLHYPPNNHTAQCPSPPTRSRSLASSSTPASPSPALCAVPSPTVPSLPSMCSFPPSTLSTFPPRTS